MSRSQEQVVAVANQSAGELVCAILTSRVWPDTAATLHARVMALLERNGFKVYPEYYIPDCRGGYGGRIDIVACLNGGMVAIELDCRRPRKKSITKLLRFDGYRIVGVRGVEGVPCPDGINQVVTMRVRQATKGEVADKRTISRLGELREDA